VGGHGQTRERLQAMMGFNRGIGLAMTVLALWLAGPAEAQESLDKGKSGAQLFASDCAICHKNAASLAKSGAFFGLSNFLSEHYTASSRSAAIIAAYVESVARAHPPSRRSGAAKRSAKGNEKTKAGEKKLGTAGAGDAKSSKPAESKTSEPKVSEPKASEPKASESNSSVPKPPEPIPNQPKPTAASAGKPEKPAKTD
jgi:mono/diheme cytochrome c family protein